MYAKVNPAAVKLEIRVGGFGTNPIDHRLRRFRYYLPTSISCQAKKGFGASNSKGGKPVRLTIELKIFAPVPASGTPTGFVWSLKDCQFAPPIFVVHCLLPSKMITFPSPEGNGADCLLQYKP